MSTKPARKIFTHVVKEKFGDEPTVVQKAVDQLVDVVQVTLGPKIKHVLVNYGYKSELLDDGVSIAQEFELENEFEDAVVDYVREAAQKTDDNAGDGTTTTMVMLRRLLTEALESGKTYPEVRAELDNACAKAIDQLKERSVPCDSQEMLLKVAKTAMDDEEAAKVVAQVVWQTGEKGAVTITEHTKRTVEFEKVEGFTLNRGYIARGMINDRERNLYIAPNKNFDGPVYVAVAEHLIQSKEDILPILEAADQRGARNLAIFCPNLIGEAMQVCAIAQMKGTFNLVAIQYPGQGEKMKDYVQDICTVTGASSPVGEMKPENLGMADSFKVSADDTIIVGGQGEKVLITAAVAELQARSDAERDDYSKEYLHQRQARLMGGVVVIKVGGVTETELRLRLKKIEDAVNACKCALEEGVSPGAGAALFKVQSGSAMLDEALQSIALTVHKNAERECAFGDGPRDTTNMLTGESGDFLEVGVVDSTKVLRTAIENAVSIVTRLYSTAVIITSKRDE